MRTTFMLSAVLFAIIGCGVDGFRNSPPVVDQLIIPDEVSPSDIIELQVVAHDGDGDALIYSWRVKKRVLDSDTISTPRWAVPIDTGFAAVMLTVDDGVNTPVSESVMVEIVHALIVPGKEAAGIKLGDRFDRVEALYATPSKHHRDFFLRIGIQTLGYRVFSMALVLSRVCL